MGCGCRIAISDLPSPFRLVGTQILITDLSFDKYNEYSMSHDKDHLHIKPNQTEHRNLKLNSITGIVLGY